MKEVVSNYAKNEVGENASVRLFHSLGQTFYILNVIHRGRFWCQTKILTFVSFELVNFLYFFNFVRFPWRPCGQILTTWMR